ncbi:aminomethyltransferase [Candidatus Xenohaliotis californiensis]|uniref:aminomethyltransferase n=1 Tax=Candidatus Xenohaliotis californiensis TaxID=84677 RepID=A0ABM9N9A6_9RICK|nr:aminomethyltransferase [Candidatus Xenohaliotis californiensis]
MEIKKTFLYQYHQDKAAKMSLFADYLLPVYYKKYGAIEEHNWTRKNASIFDVSHMPQLLITDPNAIQILKKITPSLFHNTPINKAKYTVILNKNGGIIDDWIVTKLSNESFYAVINANGAIKCITWLKEHFKIINVLNKSLIALQGPESKEVLRNAIPNIIIPKKFEMLYSKWDSIEIGVTRIGYTGEDGFELSITNNAVVKLWNLLLNMDKVQPAGLAARDSLRLEAGYPLCGSDINDKISPVEANLSWLIKSTDCYNSNKIQNQIQHGTEYKRIGFKLSKKRIPRNNNTVFNTAGIKIGAITSAAFMPNANCTGGQMYVKSNVKPGDLINVDFFGSLIKAYVHNLVFLT